MRALTAAARSLAPVHAAGWAHQALTLDVLHAPHSGRACISGWGAARPCSAPSEPSADPCRDPISLTAATDVGARRDVCAMGHLMLELVTPDVRVLRRAGRVGDAVRTALPEPGIAHRVLRHIIGAAVHPAPDERWLDAGALASELQSWLDSFGQGRQSSGD